MQTKSMLPYVLLKPFKALSRLDARQVFLLMVVLPILFHAIIWWITLESGVASSTWIDLLHHWDGSWYHNIINDGYNGYEWAFYPLYPAVVAAFASLIPLHLTLLGTIISLIAFFTFAWLFYHRALQNPRPLASDLLTARGNWTWFWLTMAPVSYIFHSLHTESLFILLSYSAFLLVDGGRSKWAALLAGLSALVRPQGVFVAIAVGLWKVPGHNRVTHLFQVGLISGALFACYPMYQFIVAGDPGLFLKAQSNWSSIDSVGAYFATFFFGNDIQSIHLGTLMHHGWWWLCFFLSLAVLRFSLPLGVYCILCLLVMPIQGTLLNSMRYTLPLFPLFIMMTRFSLRLPKTIQFAAAAVYIVVNYKFTLYYAQALWAY